MVGSNSRWENRTTFNAKAVFPLKYEGLDIAQTIEDALGYYPPRTKGPIVKSLVRMIGSKNPIIANCALHTLPGYIRGVMFPYPGELKSVKLDPSRFCRDLIDACNKNAQLLDEVLLERIYAALESNVLGRGYINSPGSLQRIVLPPGDIASMLSAFFVVKGHPFSRTVPRGVRCPGRLIS